MWSAVLASLQQHLAAAIPDAVVTVGGDAEVPEQRAVQLLRGDGDLASALAGTFKRTFHAELWEFDAADDQAAAYARLDDLELKFLEALVGWGHTQSISGWRIVVRLKSTESDGDAFRPSVGTRMTFEVEGRKTRDSSGNCT